MSDVIGTRWMKQRKRSKDMREQMGGFDGGKVGRAEKRNEGSGRDGKKVQQQNCWKDRRLMKGKKRKRWQK